MRCKYMKVKDGIIMGISSCPNFSASGSITGMKEKYYGKDALLVRCGAWIYNVTEKQAIYHAAH